MTARVDSSDYHALMSNAPLALHITFGTKGTRLHGGERGTVDRSMNQPGDPIIGEDSVWESWEFERLKHPPMYLSFEQRRFVEEAVPSICERGGWMLHACAAKSDHVHAVLSADVSSGDDGSAVRQWLKRWIGEALSERWPREDGFAWFTRGGSVKWVWTRDYFENVVEYVQKQRATRDVMNASQSRVVTTRSDEHAPSRDRR